MRTVCGPSILSDGLLESKTVRVQAGANKRTGACEAAALLVRETCCKVTIVQLRCTFVPHAQRLDPACVGGTEASSSRPACRART